LVKNHNGRNYIKLHGKRNTGITRLKREVEMNYYAARQRQKDMRWDYTVRNDDRTSPVGYCAPYMEWTEEFFKKIGIGEDHPQVVLGKNFKHKHHTGGHATREEAQSCYREYLLDQRLRLKRERTDTQKKCAVCGSWTTLYAEIDMETWDLCEAHNSREEVEKFFEPPGEIWSS
jgi:hypothetical protein